MNICTALTLIVCGAPAQNDTTPITIDDYFSIAWVSQVAISPQGDQVAWVEGRWDETIDRRQMDLWVTSVNQSKSKRLTFERSGISTVQWGEDGLIWFSSSRGEQGGDPPLNRKKQIWTIDPNDGTQHAVTHLEDGVDLWVVSKDGNALWYTQRRDLKPEDPWTELRSEFDELHYGEGPIKTSTLWKLDLNTWRTKEIYDPERVITYFDVTPSGERIAMITTPDRRLFTNEGWSRVDILETESGEVNTLEDTLWRDEAPSPYGWLESPSWSSDGQRLVFTVGFDGFPPEIIVTTFGDEVTSQRVERPEEVSFRSAPQWFHGHDLVFVAEQHAANPLIVIRSVGDGKQGEYEWLSAKDANIWSFSLPNQGNRIALSNATMTRTSQVTILEHKQLRVVADPNPHMDEWSLPQIERVQWQAEDGTTVEGVLETPKGWTKEDGPLPMYVHLHGGPTGMSAASLSLSTSMRGFLPSRGWALLSPNYRGSTGYGDTFLIQLVGRENDIDVSDILSGVDAMVERGIADPDRLAVGGWSNGGYLTNCVVAATDRFKAASSGAGVVDMTIQWAIEDTPGHVVNYMEGLPWEKTQAMIDASPLYDLDKITTPMLIHVGEGDERVPAAHAHALYRGLADYLDVPCQLVVYPNTGHGLSSRTYREAKLKWDFAWLEHYVPMDTEE